ncbi:MAG: T9SS type A sorting domain-containing protein [Ferruginibacter sp.]
MKKISLLCFALILGTMAFAQVVIQRCPISIARNNGVACGGEFSGAEIFITFDGCFEGTVAPSFTLATEDGVVIPASEFNTPTIVLGSGGCGPNSGNTLRICTRTNIAPANFLCLTFGNCPIICDAAGGPTPIILEKFAAARSGNNVNIKWQTATESNAKEFILQKKTGSVFVDFATVAATNRSNGAAYSYVDNNTTKGITEYRLKLVDRDASFKTSEIRSIKGTGASTDFTIYPNPSTGLANVVLGETFEKASIQLMDNAGRIIRTENLQNNNSTNFRNLTPGNYMIRVSNSVTGETVTKKLTVIK